jgi:GNAT superfamily N-acetyltransferase
MTPNLSPPTLFSPSELKSNTTLSKSITKLVNDAFHRSLQTDPVKWSNESSRFTDEEGLHLLLSGAGSVIALIFDEVVNTSANEKDTVGGEHDRKIVACAAAVPWKGGWAKEGADTETGWEIKIVCVDGRPEYHHRGLAVQLLNFLEKYLVARERTRLRKEGKQGEGVLGLWILAAECLNGVYWRKRGFHEVRNKVEGPGVWSCKTSFDMVVLRKDVRFDVDADSVVQQ